MAGRLILEEPLGEGAHGVVYAARTLGGVPVAVKVLRDGSAPRRAALLSEARIVASLDHPHVLPILDVGTITESDARASEGRHAAGAPFVVLERAAGSLAQRVGRLDLAEIRVAMLEVLSGLAHTHARDILHLDLKPANILVDSHGRARIADFGVSRSWDQAYTARRAGTPHYAAPELVGHGVPGPATDLYAVGCMAFELLRGSPPFADETEPGRILAAHVRRAPPRVDELGTALEEWFETALAKDPDARFPSAAVAAAALAAALPESHAAPPMRGGERFGSADTVLLDDTDLLPAPGPEPEPSRGRGGDDAPTTAYFPVLQSAWQRRGTELGAALAHLRRPRTLGREAALERLEALRAEVGLHRRPRAIALVGGQGIGKTQVAVEAMVRAREAGAARGALVSADEAVSPAEAVRRLVRRLLDLGDAPDAVVSARARALGNVASVAVDLACGRAPGADLATAFASVVRALERRLPVVLVLDRCEEGSPLVGFARRLLAAPDLAALLILTARAPLHVGESLSLGLLPHRTVEALAGELLELTPEVRTRLVVLADGHPGRARALLEGWAARGQLVPGPRGHTFQPGVAPDPDPSLAGALDTLRRDVSPSAWAEVERLAVLAPPVDPAHWQATADLPPEALHDLLLRLTAMGLVDTSDRSLRLVDPGLRAMILPAGGTPALHRRVLERLGSILPAWQRSLHLVAAGQQDEGLREGLAWAWQVSAHHASAALSLLTRLEDACTIPSVLADSFTVTRARASLAAGDGEAAEELLRAMSDAPGPAVAADRLYVRGTLLARAGRNGEALELLAESGRVDDPVARVGRWVEAADVALRVGRTARAAELVEAARACDTRNTTTVALLWARVLDARGDSAAGERMAEEALGDARARRLPYIEAAALTDLAMYREAAGDFSAAEQLNRAAVAVFDDVDPSGSCPARLNLAVLLSRRGARHEALGFVDEALRLAICARRTNYRLFALTTRASVLTDLGREEQAVRTIAVLETLLNETGNGHTEVRDILLAIAGRAETAELAALAGRLAADQDHHLSHRS